VRCPNALALGPEGAAGCSRGWSGRFARATRGERCLNLFRPEGAKEPLCLTPTALFKLAHFNPKPIKSYTVNKEPPPRDPAPRAAARVSVPAADNTDENHAPASDRAFTHAPANLAASAAALVQASHAAISAQPSDMLTHPLEHVVALDACGVEFAEPPHGCGDAWPAEQTVTTAYAASTAVDSPRAAVATIAPACKNPACKNPPCASNACRSASAPATAHASNSNVTDRASVQVRCSGAEGGGEPSVRPIRSPGDS